MDSTIQQSEIPDTLERLPAAEMMSNPYGVLAKLRERSPAVPIESKGVRYWVITRYQDVRRILSGPSERDLPKFRDEINAHCVVRHDDRLPARRPESNRSWFYQDGENHENIRRVVAHCFSPSNLKNLADVTDEIVAELVGKFRPAQQIDLLKDYARPLSARVFCKLAGMPANEHNMQAVLKIVTFLSSDKDRIEQATEALVAWAKELVEIKRNESGDDLYTSLLKSQEEIGMNKDELTSTYILLAIAGMEPANTIGSGAFLFLTHPDQLAKALAEPSLFETGIDEIARYETTYRFLAPHYTKSPLELDGVTIPAGELLLLSLGAANRDPDFIADPDVFDITRTPTAQLSFGHGMHKCMGAPLGKRQTATALRTFFERFPATKLLEPAEKIRWHSGKSFRKLEALPVVLA